MKELAEQDEYLPFGEPAHFMQRDILTAIKEATSPLSYSEIKPDGIDGNAFNHHLKTLVDKGIMQKLENSRYELTPKGRRSVDFYSLEDSRVKVRPVAGIFVLVESADGMILVYRNEAAPTYGHTGLLFGKLRLGDSYKKTLERMLERRNLEVGEVVSTGSLNIRYLERGELVANRCGPLFRVKENRPIEQLGDFGSSTQKIIWQAPLKVESEEIKSAITMSKETFSNCLDLDIELKR